MRTKPCVIVMALFLLFGCFQSSGIAVKTPDTRISLTASSISLTVDFGNGTIQTFGSLSGDTVYEATASAVEIEVEWQNNLVFVTSIQGVSNEPERGLWWQFWVNEELAPVAANLYHLDNGDRVSWRRLPPDATDNSLSLELVRDFALVGLSAIAFLLLLFTVGQRRR